MQTTKSKAISIYNLSKHINPYDICDLDKEEIINNIMDLSLEENIEQVQDMICEYYDSLRDFLEDETAVKKYMTIIRK